MLTEYHQRLFKRFFLKKEEEGFTFLELIVLVMFLGIISSIAIPQFKGVINKSKQKEASVIVSAMVKAAQANYAFNAALPEDMGRLAKFARFEKCIAKNVEREGGLVCKNSTPLGVENDDVLFYSPSGNYKVEMKIGTNADGTLVYQVKANPNGREFSGNGSAVVGCYNPSNGIYLIKEYSAKATEKGIKSYITCGYDSKRIPYDKIN